MKLGKKSMAKKVFARHKIPITPTTTMGQPRIIKGKLYHCDSRFKEEFGKPAGLDKGKLQAGERARKLIRQGHLAEISVDPGNYYYVYVHRRERSQI